MRWQVASKLDEQSVMSAIRGDAEVILALHINTSSWRFLPCFTQNIEGFQQQYNTTLTLKPMSCGHTIAPTYFETKHAISTQAFCTAAHVAFTADPQTKMLLLAHCAKTRSTLECVSSAVFTIESG